MNNKYYDDHSYLTEYKDRSTINKPLSSNDTIPRELDAMSESVHSHAEVTFLSGESMLKSVHVCSTKISYSWNELSSTSNSTRSLAVSLPYRNIVYSDKSFSFF